MSLPGNQRKLEAVEQLAQLAEEAGITLIEMALAFVIEHPAVTAAIIGPRTMEHLESQLPAADDHQRRNADVLARAGAAEVVEQRDLTGERLAARILAIAGDEARRARIAAAARAFAKPDAAKVIVDRALQLAEPKR